MLNIVMVDYKVAAVAKIFVIDNTVATAITNLQSSFFNVMYVPASLYRGSHTVHVYGIIHCDIQIIQ